MESSPQRLMPVLFCSAAIGTTKSRALPGFVAGKSVRLKVMALQLCGTEICATEGRGSSSFVAVESARVKVAPFPLRLSTQTSHSDSQSDSQSQKTFYAVQLGL